MKNLNLTIVERINIQQQLGTARYRQLGENRGEYVEPTTPQLHEMPNGIEFDWNREYREKLEKFETQKSSFEAWERFRLSESDEYTGPTVERRSRFWKYRNNSPKVVTTQLFAECWGDDTALILKNGKVVGGTGEIVRDILEFENRSPNYCEPTAGQPIFGCKPCSTKELRISYIPQRKRPIPPVDLSDLQSAYWGNQASYCVRTDGIIVGINPFGRYAERLERLLTKRCPQSRRDILTLIRRLKDKQLQRYCIILYGTFKRLYLQFGGIGSVSWDRFCDFAHDVIATFYVVDSNNRDFRYRPVVDTFRYSVNLERQRIRHELRQHFDDKAETVSVLSFDEIRSETAVDKVSGKSRLDCLTKSERNLVELICAHGQIEASRIQNVPKSTLHDRLERIREKVACH